MSSGRAPERAPSLHAVSTLAVLGPGGVGGLVAAALARAGTDVVVVAREPTAELISANGIEVRSRALGDFSARPRALAVLREPVDWLVVATKATGLDAALARIDTAPTLVVPLLNGIEHMARLRSAFDNVIAAVIRVESDRPALAQIVQTSPVDPRRSGRRSRRPALATLIAETGIEVRTGDSERQVLWSKLARLNALALTTSASDRPIGFVRTDPRWRSALEGAVSETSAVANADGAQLDAAATLAELDRAHPELGSSMQRDIAAGREPELDAIAGAVLRAGTRHGLRCPTVEWLAGRVARAGRNRRACLERRPDRLWCRRRTPARRAPRRRPRRPPPAPRTRPRSRARRRTGRGSSRSRRRLPGARSRAAAPRPPRARAARCRSGPCRSPSCCGRGSHGRGRRPPARSAPAACPLSPCRPLSCPSSPCRTMSLRLTRAR